ncbi:hypothetical protein Efla_006958 [Eimeria flavescens]
MPRYPATFLAALLFPHVSSTMRSSPDTLRSRVVQLRKSALPLTPKLYQELLNLEQALPIEPYKEIISPSPSPEQTAAEAEELSSAAQADEEVVVTQATNTDLQFTSRPYKYALLGGAILFSGGYLYIPTADWTVCFRRSPGGGFPMVGFLQAAFSRCTRIIFWLAPRSTIIFSADLMLVTLISHNWGPAGSDNSVFFISY